MSTKERERIKMSTAPRPLLFILFLSPFSFLVSCFHIRCRLCWQYCPPLLVRLIVCVCLCNIETTTGNQKKLAGRQAGRHLFSQPASQLVFHFVFLSVSHFFRRVFQCALMCVKGTYC